MAAFLPESSSQTNKASDRSSGRMLCNCPVPRGNYLVRALLSSPHLRDHHIGSHPQEQQARDASKIPRHSFGRLCPMALCPILSKSIFSSTFWSKMYPQWFIACPLLSRMILSLTFQTFRFRYNSRPINSVSTALRQFSYPLRVAEPAGRYFGSISTFSKCSL